MSKESKYAAAAQFLTSGGVQSLRQFFEVLPKTKFSREAHTSPERLGRMLRNPMMFQYRDIFNMARVLKCDPKPLADLIYNECLLMQQKKKAKAV